MSEKHLAQFRALLAGRRDHLRRRYQPYEKYAPLVAFVVGFLYDTLTLTRIDRLLDNLMLLGYVLAAGVLIAIIGRVEQGGTGGSWVARHLSWITTAAHFFLGGLLSSYVVFYFQSASVGRSFIFVALLIGLMLINEFFAHRLSDLKYLCAVYYFCCFAFLTFFLPVVTGRLNDAMFLASGVLSFILTGAIAVMVYRGRSEDFRHQLFGMARLPLTIFVTLVAFYFMNWIPPVPLALKDGGIYRSVSRIGTAYQVQYREPQWWEWWRKDEHRFHYVHGDSVYCFAAVFAPMALKEQVIHEWQQKSADGDWVTRDRLGYAIVGGRDGGYRGYTLKRRMAPGEWRVEVKTERGRLLGRIPFEVIPVSEAPVRIITATR